MTIGALPRRRALSADDVRLNLENRISVAKPLTKINVKDGEDQQFRKQGESL
jgi:hypothetical protein